MFDIISDFWGSGQFKILNLCNFGGGFFFFKEGGK